MNFIQAYFKLPLAIVYQEDKKEYYDALVASRKAENTIAFEAFMENQYQKFLASEMEQFERDMSKNLPTNKKKWPEWVFNFLWVVVKQTDGIVGFTSFSRLPSGLSLPKSL